MAAAGANLQRWTREAHRIPYRLYSPTSTRGIQRRHQTTTDGDAQQASASGQGEHAAFQEAHPTPPVLQLRRVLVRGTVVVEAVIATARAGMGLVVSRAA